MRTNDSPTPNVTMSIMFCLCLNSAKFEASRLY